jgi:hypothetical protein
MRRALIQRGAGQRAGRPLHASSTILSDRLLNAWSRPSRHRESCRSRAWVSAGTSAFFLQPLGLHYVHRRVHPRVYRAGQDAERCLGVSLPFFFLSGAWAGT